MPGVRSEGQVLIGCWCKASFVDKIDKVRGVSTRSQFCRDALVAKLHDMGIGIDSNEHIAPDRIGKGGPKKVHRPPDRQLEKSLVEKPQKTLTTITKHGIVREEHGDLRGVSSKVAERLKASGKASAEAARAPNQPKSRK